jgi:hypothetical protein
VARKTTTRRENANFVDRNPGRFTEFTSREKGPIKGAADQI